MGPTWGKHGEKQAKTWVKHGESGGSSGDFLAPDMVMSMGDWMISPAEIGISQNKTTGTWMQPGWKFEAARNWK